ncbi:MAG: hypothetical protein FJ387_15240 [Verrucomicrobia bacterium]|nr:hypothetical protein [Verrucomicrobiota bacterium]
MIRRRSFIRRVILAAGSLSLSLAPFPRAADPGLGNSRLSAARRRSLLAALVGEDARYDPDAQMLRVPLRSPGCHTTLKSGPVHPTRESLTYAVGLIEAGEPWRLERAQAILRAVLTLQDQRPDQRTYGIWPWYLEEPLERMSPPDWNWADFCGVQLLAVWLDHRPRLGMELAERIGEAIGHAARSIERRNVGPGYTNIALMGAYVTLVTAEQFAEPALLAYARARLRRVHDHILGQGSFSEYNSPTYSVVALSELTRMLRDVRGEAERAQVRALHDLAWRHVATHFHPPTRQWAGPHSRRYETDLRRRPSTLAWLEAATAGRAGLSAEDPLPLSLDACRLPLECPAPLVDLFATLPEPRTVRETFVQPDPGRRGSTQPVVGTTYLHPQYALGTVNRGDFWNQRRPVLLYWGSAAQPVYLRVRFLHDGYDFCSALVFTAQTRGCALSAVLFATDYGDTHPSLDKVQHATIQARDLRLRFEVGAEWQGAHWTLPDAPNAPACLVHPPCRVWLHRLGDSLDGQRWRWETGADEQAIWCDGVLYEGAARDFDLANLKEAFGLFALEVGPAAVLRANGIPSVQRTADRFEVAWQVARQTLRVAGPVAPKPWATLNDSVTTTAPGQGTV